MSFPALLSQAFSRGIPKRALVTALIVGPILTVINQGAAILALEGFNFLAAGLTLLVPYVVHSVGAVSSLRAIKQTVGIDTGVLMREAGEGLWNLAWKPGTDGILDRYPVGPIGSQPYTSMSQIPAGLTNTIPKDSFHVGTALYSALLEGGALLPALYAYSSSPDLPGALAFLENRGVAYIENYAPLLALLQQIVP